MSSKALPFCCASTVFLSKTLPFRAVRLSGGVTRIYEGAEAAAAASRALAGEVTALAQELAGLAGQQAATGQEHHQAINNCLELLAATATVEALDGLDEKVSAALAEQQGHVRTKALSSCCASTVFLSKTLPFLAVCLGQLVETWELAAAASEGAGPCLLHAACQAVVYMAVAIEIAIVCSAAQLLLLNPTKFSILSPCAAMQG
eukprot:SAG22_NODE_1626_length_3956_cov_2.706767_5_plen_204_part_00